MPPFPLTAAFRFLFSRKKEKAVSLIGMFSLLGVALGVATLIVVMAVMNGFRAEITGKILGLNGHVLVRSSEGNAFGYDPALETRLESLSSVKQAVPAVEGQGMILTGNVARGVMVKAVRPEDVDAMPLLADRLPKERLADFAKEPFSVLAGAQLARSLGVAPGEEITLVSSRVQSSAVGTLPRMKSFLLAGIFETGMYEYDSNMLVMRLEDAQRFFSYPGAVTQIELHAAGIGATEDAKREAEGALKDEPYEVADWTRTHASLFNALKVERSVMFLILSLIVCVAAFNIVSGLMILVRDKYYDIAILKTLGATRGQILGTFFLCGAAIGLTGTLLGVALGVAFSLNVESIRTFLQGMTGATLFDPVIYFLSELPAKLEADNVLSAMAVGVFFSFLATLYPAWKASGQPPAEALRHD
jgi:lipoprotein-releasing system permease protein